MIGVASVAPFIAVISNQKILDTNETIIKIKSILGLENSVNHKNSNAYRNSKIPFFSQSIYYGRFDKSVWLRKSSKFNNTIQWKSQQEEEMIKFKGSGLKGNNLSNFIRMIQTSIPQNSLSFINSDTTVEINQDRRISRLKTIDYHF